MMLLTCTGESGRGAFVVMLFGSGLIGGAIAEALVRGRSGVSRCEFSWTWPRPSSSELSAVEAAARRALSENPGAHFSAIWAAGRSGFGSSAQEMSREYAAFECVLNCFRKLASVWPISMRTFVHVSSAGGLFEGQVACDPNSMPKPLRPYGFGKLEQERCLLADNDLGRRLILRPSSVYGYIAGGRRGLVATLVANALQQRAVTISGHLTTLRDYVYAHDIGRFVSTMLIENVAERNSLKAIVLLLASARPSSVIEILRLIEFYLDRPVHLKIDNRPENARSNTFLPSAVANGFHATSLHEGIALTLNAVRNERLLGAHT